MRRRHLLAGASSALATGTAGCFGTVFGTTVEESFENSYDVSGETTLVVTNRNGAVTVEDTDSDQLTVSGTKEASSESALEDVSVDVTEGEQFAVEVNFSSGSDFENRRVDLTVEVPDGVTVQRAETANGDVEVRDVRGDVRTQTSNGDVTVTDVEGAVDCETSNGAIRVQGTTGLAGARTSNGLVDAELLSMTEDVTCASSNGPVTVRVGPDVAGGYVLTTTNGSATVENLDHTATESRQGYREGRLRGSSEPTLRLESTNGDVTLRVADTDE